MLNLDSFPASGIASKADVTSPNNYESRIDHFRKESYSFIPIPDSNQYYHVSEGELLDMSEKQYLHPDISMMTAFDRLQRQPFLLFDGSMEFELASDEEDREFTPVVNEIEQNPNRSEDRFFIITLADANKRYGRELFYHVVSEFEIQLANLIEEYYPNSIIEDAKDDEIERWYRAKYDGLEMHIAEHMYLSTLLKVAGKTEDIYEELGFSSRNKFDDHLGGLNELRNKVMHPTRALIHDTEDLRTQLGRVRQAKNALDNLNRGQIQPERPHS